MSGSVFCPVCQSRNTAEATNCAYCGAPLTVYMHEPKSTLTVGDSHLLTKEWGTPCEKYLPNLPAGDLALFVTDFENPILVHNPTTVILGRTSPDKGTSYVDLSYHGGFEMGVSRSHARITLDQGIFKIEDLESKNGTWLNQQHLAHGNSYELHNGDMVLLGRLHLTVCFHERLPS